MPQVTDESLTKASTDPSQETQTVPLSQVDESELIKKWEKCRLKAYLDGGGVWTIGWGHTKFVRQGDTCTQEQADEWLQEDLFWALQALKLFQATPLAPKMRQALLSFIYNVGGAAFLKSTLAKYLSIQDYQNAANELLKWNKDNGRVIQGLKNRREDERRVFLEGLKELNESSTAQPNT